LTTRYACGTRKSSAATLCVSSKAATCRTLFFYCDPPYVGSDQGHYDGYTQGDFDALLKLLERIQGKFLLSSFRNKTLKEFAGRNGWHTVELRMSMPMANSSKPGRKKIEVLAANYPVSVRLDGRVKKELVTEEEAAEQ
jgi:DNA adenine methylase